jgi:hypothetical protein
MDLKRHHWQARMLLILCLECEMKNPIGGYYPKASRKYGYQYVHTVDPSDLRLSEHPVAYNQPGSLVTRPSSRVEGLVEM